MGDRENGSAGLAAAAEPLRGLRGWARMRSVRLAFAALLVVLQLAVVVAEGKRQGKAWNAFPGEPPTSHGALDRTPMRWNRLIVSRWDAQHYLDIALNGWVCPGNGKVRASLLSCNTHFFAGYPLLARAVMRLTRLPVDYAMLAVSIASALAFFYLFTDRAVMRATGVLGAYLALTLWAAFPWAFVVVTPHTEATFFALTLGAFVALDRRRLVLAGVLAGAASGIRVHGVTTTLACAFAVLALTFVEPPRTRRAWGERALAVLVSGWGIVAMVAYDAWKFRDPFLYTHVHQGIYGYTPALRKLLDPSQYVRHWAMPTHDVVFFVAMLVAFLAGARRVLGRFDAPARAFWLVSFFGVLLVTLPLTLQRALEGQTRYTLELLPAFFCAGGLLEAAPLAFVLIAYFCSWHTRAYDSCVYIGGPPYLGGAGHLVCGNPDKGDFRPPVVKGDFGRVPPPR